MNLLVESVSVESVDVSMMGRAEPEITHGRTYVTFRLADAQSFSLDWTHRTEARPAPGSRWTLTEEEA